MKTPLSRLNSSAFTLLEIMIVVIIAPEPSVTSRRTLKVSHLSVAVATVNRCFGTFAAHKAMRASPRYRRLVGSRSERGVL
jgi:hypothetical protein